MSGSQLFRQLHVKAVDACRFTAIFVSTSVSFRAIHEQKHALTYSPMSCYVSTKKIFPRSRGFVVFSAVSNTQQHKNQEKIKEQNEPPRHSDQQEITQRSGAQNHVGRCILARNRHQNRC